MKTKKILLCIMTLLITTLFIPVTASAYSFKFTIPDKFVGSMQSTTLQEKSSQTTPYVNPTYNSLPTAYFLSTKRISEILATNIITISDGSRHVFTWNSGYGGTGVKYCLSAYPNMTGSWQAYGVEGTWSN